MSNAPVEHDVAQQKKLNISRQAAITITVSAVIILFSLLFGLSTQPVFCGACHTKEYRSWQQSAHGNFDCNYCHRRPGVFGMVTQRVEVARMVVRFPTRLYQQPVAASISNSSCLRCHENIRSETDGKNAIVMKNGLRMSHAEPDKSGYRCTDCHGGIVHAKSLPSVRQYTMGTCVNCHVGDLNGRCQSCHVDVPPREGRLALTDWTVTHGRNWRAMHGMGNLNTCVACHQGSVFCRRCHQSEVPHPPSWLYQHGAEAKTLRKNCLVCHKPSMCKGCHGVEMPHPRTFLSAHPSIIKKQGQKTCNRCHVPESCSACHVRHIHPGIERERLEKLRREAGLDR